MITISSRPFVRGRKLVILGATAVVLIGAAATIRALQEPERPATPLTHRTLTDSTSGAAVGEPFLRPAPIRRPADSSPRGVVSVFGLLALGAALALWLRRRTKTTSGESVLASVARLPLGHGQEIRLIRIRDKEVAIAVSTSGITLLTAPDSTNEDSKSSFEPDQPSTRVDFANTLTQARTTVAGDKAVSREVIHV